MDFLKNVFSSSSNNNSNNNNNNNNNAANDNKEQQKFNPNVHFSNVKREKTFNLLVIDSDKTNWVELLKNTTFRIKLPSGEEKTIKLAVYQGGWGDVTATAYSNPRAKRQTTAQAELRPHAILNGGKQISMDQKVKCFTVDFVLVRNQVVGATPETNYTRVLYALQYANVPSINSLSSIYNFIERPWVFAELNKIRERVGQNVFPLIEQNYYATHRDMLITPEYPLVVKVGHAHAGYGKVKIRDHHDFSDFTGVIALTNFYCTAESFLTGEYDLRLQKIGNHYRAMKRIGLSGSWKTNTGAAIMEDMEVTDQYRIWLEECSKMFGGLDICAVDAIHCENGEEYILEVNDTAIGLAPDHAAEDNQYIIELLFERIQQYIDLHPTYYID